MKDIEINQALKEMYKDNDKVTENLQNLVLNTEMTLEIIEDIKKTCKKTLKEIESMCN